ncbi:MAG: glyoxalase family protein [Gammaproteobacteria bacterium]|nr:glyoxalase family protein [Gammaproteobacteria bacterium]
MWILLPPRWQQRLRSISASPSRRPAVGDHRNDAIDYVEFPATDLERTKSFYGAAFGWTFVDYGPRYAAFQGAGVDGGFTLDAEVAARGGVLVVLYQEALGATLARVRELGGEITRETFAFPGGHRFHFRDPNGNELAVWSESA